MQALKLLFAARQAQVATTTSRQPAELSTEALKQVAGGLLPRVGRTTPIETSTATFDSLPRVG